MKMFKYQGGHEIVWIGNEGEVRGANGEVNFAGSEIECVKWLAAHGDQVAQRELAARTDA
jgi:hypothetical protein